MLELTAALLNRAIHIEALINMSRILLLHTVIIPLYVKYEFATSVMTTNNFDNII